MKRRVLKRCLQCGAMIDKRGKKLCRKCRAIKHKIEKELVKIAMKLEEKEKKSNCARWWEKIKKLLGK